MDHGIGVTLSYNAGMASILAICLFLLTPAVPDDSNFLGRWDMTVTTSTGAERPSWLEVSRDGDTLKARMVGTGGGAFPVPEVAITNGELVFTTGSQGKNLTVYRAKLDGPDKLTGTQTFGTSNPRPWTAVRGPKW